MVDLNDHKCMSEYTDEELLEQGRLDIQARSRGIRDDRTFSKQYIVLKEIGKRWIREHENIKKENIVSNQFKSWSDDKLLRFYKERKEIYNGNFPISYINMLAEISNRWIEQNEVEEVERRMNGKNKMSSLWK